MSLPTDLGQHRGQIEILLGYIEPWERRVAQAIQGFGVTFDYVPKTEWLITDLRALGLSDSEIASLPRCESLPSFDEPEALFGSLYVWEGSTLGGQFITRHLQSELGIGPESGGRFHASYGGEVGERWRQFRRFLESKSSPLRDDAIVQGAEHTFHTFANWCATARRDVSSTPRH